MGVPNRSRGARSRWGSFLTGLCLVMSLVLGCGGDGLTPTPLADEDTLYWDLNLSHHAVTLSMTAPYDTLTVRAVPRNVRGEPLLGLPTPQFTSADPEAIGVGANGQLVANAPSGQPVTVTATMTVGNLKHKDHLLVRVVPVDHPPRMATFSVQPVPPDSAKRAAMARINGAMPDTLRWRAVDSTGAPMESLFVSYRSSDTTVAWIEELSGRYVGYRPGRLRFYASAAVYGVALADTVDFRFGWPLISFVGVFPDSSGPTPRNRLSREEVAIATGGMVMWEATGADTTVHFDVSFENPSILGALTGTAAQRALEIYDAAALSPWGILACFVGDCTATGNFVLTPTYSDLFGSWVGLGVATRVFTAPGTYTYRSELNDAGGRIVVVDDREGMPGSGN